MEERSVIEELRARRPPVRLLRGFAPLLLGLLLAVLMVISVPSVAPEEIVRTPVGAEEDE
ncbi:MAG TPA: hypothetical protein VEA78_04055 [Acidimicrobiales bacterium]|nr:hypothetical protein [Acidimicrobiales bacterium]